MSSLIASASPWNNDNTDSGTRKRIPTMRKTVKVRPYAQDVLSQADVSETVESMANIDDTQSNNAEHTNKVNELITQMANVSPDNDGNGLVDFKPPPMPESHLKKDAAPLESTRGDDSSVKIQRPATNPFINTQSLGGGEYNNYHTAYESTPIISLPNYGSASNIQQPPSIYDNRLADKINYMIHLLENQESERTANVTEEFILYTFLGVFMIYICDSFSRGGRYVR